MPTPSTRRRIARPARARRSHAERTAETRGRALAAVVQSIGEVGYQRTTATEITRRAGITWGAVQHHFGDKDGILTAVLEETFNRFAERLAGVPAGGSLEERIARFVDRSWEHFGSSSYCTAFVILLNLPSDLEVSWQDQMFAAWSGVWSQYFPGSKPSRRRTAGLMYYTISVLSGLAATQMLSGRSVGRLETELGYLKDTLVRELARCEN